MSINLLSLGSGQSFYSIMEVVKGSDLILLSVKM